MTSDPLRDFASLERELRHESLRPIVWTDVVRGAVSPEQATQGLHGDEHTSQEHLARDHALFAPLDSAKRDALLRQIIPEAAHFSRRRSARQWPWVTATTGMAAALGLLLLILVRDPRRPTPVEILEMADDIAISVEVLGGTASFRGDPIATSPTHSALRLPAGQPFRIEVRVQGRTFDLSQVIARCGSRESNLPFTVLATRPGLLEAELRAELEPGQHCELELRIDDGGRVFRLPGTTRRVVEIVQP
jgi:hypothetical protein